MKFTIGKLTASIAGDTRYTDILEVIYDQDDGMCQVEVNSSTPRGGMDGDPTPFRSLQSIVTLPKGFKAKDLLEQVKRVVAMECYNFKKYGRPTKCFCWYPEGDMVLHGLNVKVVADVLGAVR